MSDFEKEYYEAESFWTDGQVMDEANLQRIKATADLIPIESKSLLDVGCGNGVFLNWLLSQNTNIELTGTDRSNTALKYVKAKHVLGDIAELPFEDSSFDCVSCLEVIEHLPLPVYSKALSELVRVSKKYILVSVPFEEKLEEAHTKCPNCKTIFNSDLHFRSFNEIDFKNLLTPFNCKNISHFKLGEFQRFKGHKLYQKYFYPEQILAWNSPICPLCGFSNAPSEEVVNHNSSKKSATGIRAMIKSIPKLIWPKEKKYYWIIGLFEKC